jgi:hypothetical protein
MGSRKLRFVLVALAAVLPISTGAWTAYAAGGPTVNVLTTGLLNPRGMTFGPDGMLYLAEGGSHIVNGSTTAGQCEQVPAPVGPYTGGHTSRISRIDPSTGARSTVVGGLASSQTSPMLGTLVSGVADVKFLDGALYALTAGSGCSHGLAGTTNGILRVNGDGTTTQIANLSAFQQSHPVANPNPPDFEPDGTWYSMVVVRDSFYAVEPNHGEVDAITPAGDVSRLIDISASQGHIVPTALTYHGNFYLGNLNVFDPGANGHSKVFKITPSGQLSVVADGLTAVLGVAFQNGQLYALESFTGSSFPTPGTGKVVRLDRDTGTWVTVVDHLVVPTSMTFGPDGNLYIANIGYGAPDGAGQILKVTLPRS